MRMYPKGYIFVEGKEPQRPMTRAD